MIHADRNVCSDPERARKLEWLETNGLGGFASSTIIGLNTRRYHALLTAAMDPPAGRLVLLSKLEETLRVNGRHFDLAANQYPGVLYPQGFRYLKEFRLDPFPVFVYQVEEMEIEKRIFLVHGENTAVIEYEFRGPQEMEGRLELRPLIAFRDYHATTHHNDGLDRAVKIENRRASVAPYAGLPALFLAHNADATEATGEWYFNFEYARELERGLDAYEDLFNPLVLRFAVARNRACTVIASTEPRTVEQAGALREKEIARRKQVVRAAGFADPFLQQLAAAADQFLVQRGSSKTIVAGYHWFTDWGRDTMISLPGLTLATGRHSIAKEILATAIESADRGMVPNRFREQGRNPEYNSVDAALWLFETVRAYLQSSGDEEFARCHYQELKEILEWHVRGTRFGIRADNDGLLLCGEPGVQLTWMDAKVGEQVVTPRPGKPVEVQALWYNALRVMEELARQAGDAQTGKECEEIAGRARESFPQKFWNREAGCLYDVIEGEQRDASIRPNQIFAVSLRHRMLTAEQELAIAGVVQRELLTPLGLRSLSSRDPAYRGRCEGGVRERDSAYHQGTVWPWLMGPFLTAYLHVHGRSAEAMEQARAWLEPFQEHLKTAGLGQICEIADGDAPHAPRGCIAQAWSVAEVLRVAAEIFSTPSR